MTPEQMQAAYERLAMLHTETMAELVETQRRLKQLQDSMDQMSHDWWALLKRRIKSIFKREPEESGW